ncbi:hypothetical protein D3C73_1347140 [compost metagenome]
MITVLLAPPGVATSGLQVSSGVGADPHIGVGRRHGQGVDAFDLVGVGDALARGIEITELAAQLPAGESGLGIVDVMQVGGEHVGQGGIGHGNNPWARIRGAVTAIDRSPLPSCQRIYANTATALICAQSCWPGCTFN